MSLIILPGERKDDWAFENGKEVLSLTLRDGTVILIDAEDLPRVSTRRWYAGGKYVSSFKEGTSGPTRGITLHRFIMDAPDGVQVDHINRNTLDNRRSNLRLCTASQNRYNQKPRKDSVTGFKGVSFHPDKKVKQWQAKIIVEGRKISLKYHATAEEAALAYNRAAVIHHGEFARLNEVGA